MQTRAPGKWVFRFLLLLCVLQGGWILLSYKFTADLSEIIRRYPVGDKAMVYVVVSDSGGATVPFTYHYFVHRAIEDDSLALESLRDNATAFLITRDHDAQTSVFGNQIKIAVKRQVFHFHNPAMVRLDDDYLAVDVWLDAQIDYENDG
ncbi:hypothetical protein [Pseudomonas abietaniphila]|nr:hypothetical protein [Pseudomonas abietaniphila]